MKQNCKSQVGRSMIEMLGVLFVIGILSIGGIVTYRIAMRNILGNDILDLAATFSLSVDAEYMKSSSPYRPNTNGTIFFSKYFCDNYLGKEFCSKESSSQKYFLSNDATWHAYTSDSAYGRVFCFGYRFLNQKRDRQLCRSLVAQTANLENLVFWTNYHHYKVGQKQSQKFKMFFVVPKMMGAMENKE